MAHPIHLVFSGPDGKTITRGPYDAFCLQGETLREKIGAPPLAVHEDHHWRVDGSTYSRFDCDCAVKVHLMRVDGRRRNQFGPFESFSAQDGVAYVDHSLFAFADRSIGDWYCHVDGQHWSIVVVEATDQA